MLFLKSTAKSLAPGIFDVDIAAKPPGKTFGIFIAVDAEHLPQQLIDSIQGLGFKQNRASPYTHSDGKKVIDLHFEKAGSDIFEGWTEAERTSNIEALTTLFKGINIDIHPRVMTLAEAF